MIDLIFLYVPFYCNSSQDRQGSIRIFPFLRKINGFAFGYGIFLLY